MPIYMHNGFKPILVDEVISNSWANVNGVQEGDEIWQGKRENDKFWTYFKDLTRHEQESFMESRPLHLRIDKRTGEFYCSVS